MSDSMSRCQPCLACCTLSFFFFFCSQLYDNILRTSWKMWQLTKRPLRKCFFWSTSEFTTTCTKVQPRDVLVCADAYYAWSKIANKQPKQDESTHAGMFCVHLCRIETDCYARQTKLPFRLEYSLPRHPQYVVYNMLYTSYWAQTLVLVAIGYNFLVTMTISLSFILKFRRWLRKLASKQRPPSI